MAYASVTYPNQTGSTTSYAIPFGYIDESDITVTVEGVSTSFTFTSASVINISPAPTGDVVIQRTTPIADKVTTFEDGSAFLASDANNQNDQFLFALQEGIDSLGSAQSSAAAALASEQAAAASEAAAAASAAAAGSSETAAAGSATAASGSANTASTQATNAANSATAAASSATAAAGSATAAASSATSASGSATTATTQASNASTSATNAASSASAAATSASNAATSATAAAAAVGGVRVSSGDTTPSTLDAKVLAGSNITLTKGNAGANETYTIAVSGLGSAAYVATSTFATAAQGTKADSALQASDIGSTVQGYDATTMKTGAVQTMTKVLRGTPVALTSSSASIATDASAGNFFTHTFTENTTLANPSNLAAGQEGVIVFTQHASSPKTLAFGSYWKFSGGTVPSVTATNSAVDVLVYYVESSTRITAKLLTDVK